MFPRSWFQTQLAVEIKRGIGVCGHPPSAPDLEVCAETLGGEPLPPFYRFNPLIPHELEASRSKQLTDRPATI